MVQYPRTIWVVRHCEREDNIDHNWRKKAEFKKFHHDNSPLSARGKKQADELANRFKNVTINHCFASPFDRTIETAAAIVKGKNLLINPEPGFIEVLYLCEKPPSYWENSELKKHYPDVNENYLPFFTKNTLPKEDFGDEGCIDRVGRTLEHIFGNYHGDLLFVSHGAAIGAIHANLVNDFLYVGQATVSKFVETQKGVFEMKTTSDSSHLSDQRNLRPW
ncbi:unnamed protein product, partial [Mesorhabditis belari]|uniref:Phosphoglycerate mutase n=1 Tax=Mesorhabditis belari TaxID=2138241 RepID=A0AAF3E7K5_9BILA